MKKSVYRDMKLDILMRAKDGEITESACDQLLEMLESKKEATELTDKAIKDFFDELEDKYPDLEDDIEKLMKKIEKAGESEEPAEEESEGEGEEADGEEEQVSEAYIDLMSKIDSLFED